jgi:hypothetical protein
MDTNLETLLNGYHCAAFVLAFALPLLLPGCLAAAAGLLYKITLGLRVGLRLWRTRLGVGVVRAAWRRIFVKTLGVCLME